MRAAIVVFPGSNCDRDAAEAVRLVTGQTPHMAWHGDADLPPVDLIVLPGGFSYGDYLRTGAMASQSPVMKTVRARAEAGVRVLGICNGFQILCETQLLPGALLRNRDLKFIAKPVALTVANSNTDFTRRYKPGEALTIPVAHGEGNYFADADTLKKLRDDGRVVFRYRDNPNGSAEDIAGICNARGNVLGMMPHPERAVEPLHGRTDGLDLFKSIVESLA